MMYIVQDGVLMRNNNGYDKDTKPMISFKEFLVDLYNGNAKLFGRLGAFDEFKKQVDEMEQEEMTRMPLHMQELFLRDYQTVIRETRSAYEGYMNDHDVHKAARDSKNKCAVCVTACNEHCAKCKMVYYCSRDHQTEDWNNHKGNCKVLRRFKDGNYHHETTIPNFDH